MARGDHLRVHRFSGYWHHGIDVGGDRVVHYAGSVRNVAVCISWVDVFRRRGEVEIVPYAACDPPELVVERALSRLGEHGYNLLTNNCEHFARWCKTGFRPASRSFARARATLATLGVVAVVFTVAAKVA